MFKVQTTTVSFFNIKTADTDHLSATPCVTYWHPNKNMPRQLIKISLLLYKIAP